MTPAFIPRFIDQSTNFVTRGFRMLTILLLIILLGGSCLYVAYFLYFLSGSSWGMPAILGPSHERVLLIQGTIADRSLKMAEIRDRIIVTERSIRQVEEEERQARMILTSLETFVATDVKSLAIQAAQIERSLEASRKEATESRQLLTRLVTEARPEEELRRQLIDRTRYLAELTLRQNLSHSIVTSENNIRTLELMAFDTERRHQKSLDLGALTGEDTDRLVIKAKAMFLVKDADLQKAALEKTLETLRPFVDNLEAQIRLLKRTPAGQAGTETVVAIFVPYDNTSGGPGQPIYGCLLQIIFCSQIGTMTGAHDAEIALPHPLFGKPVRGSLYVVKISREDAKRSLIFTQKPLFF